MGIYCMVVSSPTVRNRQITTYLSHARLEANRIWVEHLTYWNFMWLCITPIFRIMVVGSPRVLSLLGTGHAYSTMLIRQVCHEKMAIKLTGIGVPRFIGIRNYARLFLSAAADAADLSTPLTVDNN